MRAPIHSRKHIVQTPFSQITTGTAESITLLDTVNVTVANAANEVQEGAVVKAIFIEMWLQNSANDGHQIVCLGKTPETGQAPVFSEMAALDGYPQKNNLFFIHEGLSSNDGVGNPQAIMNGWYKIPKGKQRMALGDQLTLTISNPSSNNLNRCGKTIYKEYT